MRRLLVAVAVAVVVVSLRGAAPTPEPRLPSSIAVLGDSLSRGYGATSAATDAPGESWATGGDAAVGSHYLRLLARNPAIAGRAFNDARSGSPMAATTGQAARAIGQRVEYVAIESGTNDVCVRTVAAMTGVADFSAALRATLTQVTSALPGVTVFVTSIPDWHGLWSRLRADPAVAAAWRAHSDRCPTLLGATPTDAERSAVDRRIAALNDAIATTCASFRGCTDDGGATFALWSTLDRDDLAFDGFHLSVRGQARLAEATWAATPFAG